MLNYDVYKRSALIYKHSSVRVSSETAVSLVICLMFSGDVTSIAQCSLVMKSIKKANGNKQETGMFTSISFFHSFYDFYRITQKYEGLLLKSI